MRRDILDMAQRLRGERRPFALATVVAVSQPASASPGARALIGADGHIAGWVGGHCAQPTVIRQALDALADGVPRLLMLSPDAPADSQPRPGVVQVPMRCASQGELEIFIEPFLPKTELVVIGASPVAATLARLGSLLEFEVCACDPLSSQLTPRSYVIVATIGVYDEEATQTALESSASYVGLVASQKRFAAVQCSLRERGVLEERLSALKRPKGTRGRAALPAEIAFSVMAELLEMRRQGVGRVSQEAIVLRADAIDPICGMTVDVATARHKAERAGQTYYFCCAGCHAQFEAAE